MVVVNENETTTRTNAAGHEVRCASLLSQMLSLIDRREFAAAVQRTGADERTKGFRCWEQFVATRYCQLAQTKSLREISQGLACCEGRLRPLGMEEAPGMTAAPGAPTLNIAKYLDNRRSFTLIELDPWKLILRQINENGAGFDSIAVTKPN